MKEVHHWIACLYLYEQIKLRSLLASKDSTQKWSNQLISNHTLTVQDKRRTAKFPRMNPCFYLIIRTKLLHHGCLFGENENIFLFMEKLHQLRKRITLDILNSHRRMLRIGYLIYLYRRILTTNPLKIRCEIESKSQRLWVFIFHETLQRIVSWIEWKASNLNI